MQNKSFSLFQGPPLSPSNTLLLFFRYFFFFNIKKDGFDTNSRFFRLHMHVIKKEEIFDRKIFKVFPNVGEGTLIKKNLVKPWIRLHVFFLSSLAYKLVNLLVFEKKSCRMSKNWIFLFNYWSGTQLYLWIWSLF